MDQEGGKGPENNQKYKIVGFKIIRGEIGIMVWIYGFGGVSLYGERFV